MRSCRSRGAEALAIIALTVASTFAAPSVTSAAPAGDDWLAGYVAAVLERELHIAATPLAVQAGIVTLDPRDVPPEHRGAVIAALRRIRGVRDVAIAGEVVDPATAARAAPASPTASETAVPSAALQARAPSLGFLPGGRLFQPLLADPRWPHLSGAYRYSLRTKTSHSVFAATFGETIPLYRDELGESGRFGYWETGLQAGVFSIFDLDSPSFDLINTDFIAAALAAYRHGRLSAIGRIFHQSSHLGDELLLRDTRPERINLSYEGVDVRLSYDLPRGFRAYGGGGYLIRVDPAGLGRGFGHTGAEWRSPWVSRALGVRPVAGLDLQFREQNDWHTDLSLRAGVQFERVSVLSRNLQVLVEYFNGRSFDGQFYRLPVEYVGLGVHFNF
jgi:hypothetical protein